MRKAEKRKSSSLLPVLIVGGLGVWFFVSGQADQFVQGSSPALLVLGLSLASVVYAWQSVRWRNGLSGWLLVLVALAGLFRILAGMTGIWPWGPEYYGPIF